MKNNMNILVTGAAGFIGMHVAQRLLAEGDQVVGLDNLNDYYSPQLKCDRVAAIEASPGAERFRFVHASVEDMDGLAALCQAEGFDGVVHLAAQAGVNIKLADNLGVHLMISKIDIDTKAHVRVNGNTVQSVDVAIDPLVAMIGLPLASIPDSFEGSTRSSASGLCGSRWTSAIPSKSFRRSKG